MASASDNAFGEKTTTSTAIVPLLENSVDVNNGNFYQRRSSGLPQRKLNQVSMDLLSAGTLSFHHINYALGETKAHSPRKPWCPFGMKSKPPQQILHDISGIFKSGMNAIMGKYEHLKFMIISRYTVLRC